MTVVAVHLWGRRVGAISDEGGLPAFEYDPEWRATGPSISPVHLPLEPGVFSFPELRRQPGFEGMPGVFADSLPDRFGNRVIRAWLAGRGLAEHGLPPTEKLLYVGRRAMGALEYEPPRETSRLPDSDGLELARLVRQARRVVRGEAGQRLGDIMAAASSAGGMRAKALLGWNRATGELLANQPELPEGFEPWIFKFDGMGDDGRPQHWTRLEYAYFLMARAAGLDMSETVLVPDEELAHFATRRFDRAEGRKVHMHSLCGLMHADFNEPRQWSYELYLRACLKLGLGMDELAQAYRRMVFNVIARNQDDHTKNLAFLLDEGATEWRLAPAFDITYANGSGWTAQHQMSVNGKFADMERDDLDAVAELFGIKRHETIIGEVADAVSRWPEFAGEAGLPKEVTAHVAADHRLFDI